MGFLLTGSGEEPGVAAALAAVVVARPAMPVWPVLAVVLAVVPVLTGGTFCIFLGMVVLGWNTVNCNKTGLNQAWYKNTLVD